MKWVEYQCSDRKKKNQNSISLFNSDIRIHKYHCRYFIVLIKNMKLEIYHQIMASAIFIQRIDIWQKVYYLSLPHCMRLYCMNLS